MCTCFAVHRRCDKVVRECSSDDDDVGFFGDEKNPTIFSSVVGMSRLANQFIEASLSTSTIPIPVRAKNLTPATIFVSCYDQNN